MRHIALFNGIGGFQLAADWMGWENVAHCEIDDFCNRVVAYHSPNSKCHRDIKDFDGRKYYGTIDILTGGFPCFPEETLVLTSEGYKKIKEVTTNDTVLTKEGNWQKVNAVMSKEKAPTVNIKFQGDFTDLVATDEHPVWVRKRAKPRARKYKNRFSKGQWVKASEISKGDLIAFRCIDGFLEYKTIDFWFFVGRFLGDGWILDGARRSKIPQGHRGSRVNSKNYRVVICCNKKEKEETLTIIKKAGFTPTISEERTTTRFIISSKKMVKFFSDFGRYSYGKKLPGYVFNLTNNRKKALFKGWLSADGYVSEGGSMRVTTVSPLLARGMAQIARDIYRIPVSVSKKTTKRNALIEGRTINERPQYCVVVNKKSKVGFYENGLVWTVVKKKTFGKKMKVYNIGVNEDETYTANGIAVHNCQPFSVAGKQRGKKDDRFLWGEMLRTIQEIRPNWVIAENVSGLLTIDNGLVFEQVLSDLESENYEVQAFVIPACAVNAPHRRDRVWIIAHNNQRDREKVELQTGRQVNPDELNTAPHSESLGHRGRSSKECASQEWQSSASEQERRDLGSEAKGCCGERVASNTQSPRQQVCQDGQRKEKFWRSNPRNSWENFPTQPPLCSGDDGLPSELAGLTFPKWRAESIKAYGNAIVPQVAYQIFKAIQEVENKIKEQK